MRPGTCLSLRSLVRCALFVAAGIVLGQLFHLVGMGPTFLPLHLPAQIGGLLLGAQAGLLIGICTPLASSLLTGMPPLLPMALRMVVEMGAYGYLAGLLHRNLRLAPLPSLLGAILGGRLLMAVADSLFFWHLGLPRLSVAQNIWLAFSFGLPGVCLQLALVPSVLALLKRHLGEARRRARDLGSPLPGFLAEQARKGLEAPARRLQPGGEEESP